MTKDVLTISKQTLWQAATIALAVLVLLAIFTDWFVIGPSAGRQMAGGSGKVVIEEYSDFQCPFCAKFFTDTYPQIKQAYGDKVEFVYKHFPLDFHENAQKAAEASECARDQGKFWEMHDKMFQNQGAIGVSDLKSYAKSLGLDTEKFGSCLDSGEKASSEASRAPPRSSSAARRSSARSRSPPSRRPSTARWAARRHRLPPRRPRPNLPNPRRRSRRARTMIRSRARPPRP